MDEQEIRCSLESFDKFGGCFARDEIPQKLEGPIGIVVNTEKRGQPGEHWIAIYIDKDGVGELFDSLASHEVLEDFHEWMELNTRHYLFPVHPLQSSISKLCGVYVISYLALRFKNESFNQIISSFAQNPVVNDLWLIDLLKNIK